MIHDRIELDPDSLSSLASVDDHLLQPSRMLMCTIEPEGETAAE
jgi:hypothetical protein